MEQKPRSPWDHVLAGGSKQLCAATSHQPPFFCQGLCTRSTGHIFRRELTLDHLVPQLLMWDSGPLLVQAIYLPLPRWSFPHNQHPLRQQLLTQGGCKAGLPNRWGQAWVQQGKAAPSRLSSSCHVCTNVVAASKCFASPFLYRWNACVNAQAVPKQLTCSKIFKMKWCASSTQCFSFKMFFA